MNLRFEPAHGNDPQVLGALRPYLQDESIESDQFLGRPDEAAMSADLVTLVSVVLSSAAVVQLARAVHTWIIHTRPGVKVRLVDGTRTLDIDCINPKDADALASEIAARFFGDGYK